MVAGGGRGSTTFDVKVMHSFGLSHASMAAYLDQMDEKLKRGTIRKMVTAAGTILAKEVRVQIKRRNMPYSRARNVAERRKSKKEGTVPLSRTIKTKYWSRPAKGIIGSVVGPEWPQGSHGHLVEFGHRITGKARVKFRAWSMRSLLRGKIRSKTYRIGRMRIARSGQRTVAHEFQQSAMVAAENNMYHVMATAMGRAINKLQTRVSV